MNELDIEIEEQELKKHDLHMSVFNVFDYGRSPRDEEYLNLSDALEMLGKVEYSLIVLKELKKSIEHNKQLATS